MGVFDLLRGLEADDHRVDTVQAADESERLLALVEQLAFAEDLHAHDPVGPIYSAELQLKQVEVVLKSFAFKLAQEP